MSTYLFTDRCCVSVYLFIYMAVVLSGPDPGPRAGRPCKQKKGEDRLLGLHESEAVEGRPQVRGFQVPRKRRLHAGLGRLPTRRGDGAAVSGTKRMYMHNLTSRSNTYKQIIRRTNSSFGGTIASPEAQVFFSTKHIHYWD